MNKFAKAKLAELEVILEKILVYPVLPKQKRIAKTKIIELEPQLDARIQLVQCEFKIAKTKEDKLLFFKYLSFLSLEKQKIFFLKNPELKKDLSKAAERIGKKMQSGCETK